MHTNILVILKEKFSTMHLSVVICTYNRGKYLAMVLNSLKDQNLPLHEFEIIIINNNSTDDTDQIIKSYQQNNPELPLHYYIEYQQGISYARNRGVEAARGDIIVFIDDDETVDPDFLQQINLFFTKYPDAGISSGPVIPVYETAKPEWLSPYIMRAFTGAYDKGDQIKLLPAKDYPGTGHACFRRDLFLKYGAFNTLLGRKGNSLMGAEDKDFFLRLINGGEKCYYLPTATIYHHIPESKLTDEFFRKLTFAIGKSERIRTLQIGNGAFAGRLMSEAIKWGASFIIGAGYLIIGQIAKANKLIQFRWWITKGLFTNTALPKA